MSGLLDEYGNEREHERRQGLALEPLPTPVIPWETCSIAEGRVAACATCSLWYLCCTSTGRPPGA
jgi:hypothetical protein